MSNLKILLPLDGTEKSMNSINWLKKFFSKEDVEITMIIVIYSDVIYRGEITTVPSFEKVGTKSKEVLEKAAKELEGYKINKLSAIGYTPDVILKEAKEGNYDMIVMAKSSVKGIARIIGSVTNKVVRNSEVAVIVVPE
jgi:nucleotide-binding universal stress UspA family protein